MRSIFGALLTAVIISLSPCVFAGGPFLVDSVNDSGVAEQWLNNEMVWYSETGDLSSGVNNETAITWITDALNMWTGAKLHDGGGNYVQTVDVTATHAGSRGDVDESNYFEYVSSATGPTMVIFDKNGMITKDLAGANYQYIPGLSELLLSDSTGTKILKGVVILNGALLGGGEIVLSQAQFKGVVLHELGHLMNLDHTQVNLDSAEACELGGTCAESLYIPTMFPELKTSRQGSELKIDDKVTISWIYPNDTFRNSFCTVTGEIQDKDGNPLQGVNVIAKRVSATEALVKEDSRSMVSGVMYPACTSDGHYYLYGLVPGRSYEVIYEPLSSQYTGMSGFEPLANPPSGFDTGSIGTVNCETGGTNFELDAVKVDVTNPCPTDGGEAATTGGTSSGGCTLIIPK